MGRRTVGRLLGGLVVVVLCLLVVPAFAAASTITAIGPGPAEPLAVNAQQEVLLSSGLWVNGMVSTPQAPSSDASATFTPGGSRPSGLDAGGQDPEGLSGTGLVAGSVRTGGGSTVPGYWASSTSTTFTELSLSGLTVNGQPAAGGELTGVDGAGEAVGMIWDQAVNSGDGTTSDYAGLFVPASGGLPAGQPEAVSSIDGTQIYSLFGISATYEAAVNVDSCVCAVLVDRQTQTPMQTDLTHTEDTSVGFADNGIMSGYLYPGDPILPDLRLADGSLTSLTAPLEDNVLLEDVNASGVTVGSVQPTTSYSGTGTVWDSTGSPTSLLEEVSDDAGWTALSPRVIDDAGDIVGSGTFNGAPENFLIPGSAIVATPPVVNSAGDGEAVSGGTQGCNTGNTVTDGSGQQVPECTLRAAIQAENANSVDSAPITFTLPASANGTIQPATPLPALTAAGVTIDATPGPGGAVTLDGANVSGSATVGLELSGAGETVKDLVLQEWPTAIKIDSAAGGDVLTGNVISPSSATVNLGVDVEGSPNNQIGGAATGDGNTIENTPSAILINGAAASGNLIQGNLIGTDTTGSVFEGVTNGIVIINASGTTVGGSSATPGAAPGNVIDGRQTSGVGGLTSGGYAVGVGGVTTTVTATTVEGNAIGMFANGSEPSGSYAGFGLGVESAGLTSGTVVGGSSPGEGNVITGAAQAAVYVDGTSVTGTQVLGNLIGTDLTGLAAPAPNGSPIGVFVAGANHTTIGTPGAGANVITAQPGGGVGVLTAAVPVTYNQVTPPTVLPGTNQTATTAMSTLISGNIIGPLANGTSLPSGTLQPVGISLAGIGDTAGPNNQISGNQIGVRVSGNNESVLGNLIGTNGSGVTALPNGTGVTVTGTGAQIGVPGSRANTISGNLNELVLSADATVQNNLIGTTALGNAPIGSFTGTLPEGMTGTFENPEAVFAYASAAGSQIGGTQPGSGNVISGNPSDGLDLDSAVVVQGNNIGVGANGSTAVPNSGDGIDVDKQATLGAIFPGGTGMTAAVGGNIIANNTKAGIEVQPGTSAVSALSDSIYGNGLGGIALDGGANEGIVAPSLIKATQAGDGSTSLQVVANSVDVGGSLQVFVADSCTSTSAQGKTLLDTISVPYAGILIPELPLQPVGTALTATITHGSGASASTSQFSTCITVEAGPATPGSPASGSSSSPTTPGSPSSGSSSSPPDITGTTVSITSSVASTDGSTVTLPATVTCSSAAPSSCKVTDTGTVSSAKASTARATATLATAKHKKATPPLQIGSGSLTLAAGTTATLKLKLTSHGLTLLRSQHSLAVTITIKITGNGRATITHTLNIHLTYKKATKAKPKKTTKR